MAASSNVDRALGRRLEGKIAYRDRDGCEVGREFFDILSHAGGHILRALCMIDEARLVRDVSISLDAQWRPEDGYCRITRDGVDEAVFWLRQDAGGTWVDSSLAGDRRPTQFLPSGGRPPYFGLHPLQGDAIIVEQRGTSDPGRFVAIEAVTNSVSPNGDEQVGARRIDILVAYLGEEQIAVSAGGFAARRYALRWRDDWPPADLWVRKEDNLFLCMRWSLTNTWYELVEWRQSDLGRNSGHA